jgi:GT2 family glycosyltransferase
MIPVVTRPALSRVPREGKLALSDAEVLSKLEGRARPAVSICIVNWNCRDYLKALLSSIESEREKVALEVIVVDNASTDDSASMVKIEFPEVRLICNLCHEGLARSNNKAAQRGCGDLLMFLNDDTVIPAGALTTLVQFFEQHPDLCAVMPCIVNPDGKPQETVRKTLRFRAALHRISFLRWTRIFRAAEREFRQPNFDLTLSSYVEQIVGAALMVRRRQFMSIGGYDEGFEWGLEGLDLSVRLGQLGKLYYLAEAQVIHWGGVATKLDEPFTYRGRECGHAYYLRKHCGPWPARLYKLLTTVDMPLRVSFLALRWLGQALVGNRQKAPHSYARFAAAAQFLFYNLPEYWRS